MLNPKKTDWIILSFLAATQGLSLAGLAYYIPRYGIHPLEPIACALYVFIVAMVVSGGYHRYFAHKTFECHPLLKAAYLLIGAAAFQQSALVWAVDHRMHHRHVDTELDPYNIKKGFWHAHIGWLLLKDPAHRESLHALAPDLAKDRWVMWQHKYWLWISIPLGFGLPLLAGFWIGRPLGMFLWVGLLRIAITHHTTFTINSIAHKFGVQPYTDQNSARDVWWLGPLLCGEHYHNYHHRFQSDYRNGVRWYHYDPTKWALWTFSKLGLAKGLRRTPYPQILKARLEMDMKRLETRLKPAPKEFWMPLHSRLVGMRLAVEEAAELYSNARKNYRDFKKSVADRSHDSIRKAKEALRERETIFEQRLGEWKKTVSLGFKTSFRTPTSF